MSEPVKPVLLQQYQAAESEIAFVPCDVLRVADSPRLEGESREHIRMLAESLDKLPPILVHRPSMRIIDGVHRFHATRLSDRREIQVRFFDGNEDDIFLMSVRENIAHGLPLSLADRKAAAARVLEQHPDWSDRLIASTTGLSHKTIGAIRTIPPRATGENAQLLARKGHDGRVRPLSSSEGRRLAADLLNDDPTASLRAVAHKAGISPGTVRDVRDRLKRGLDPVGRRSEGQAGTESANGRGPAESSQCMPGAASHAAQSNRVTPIAAQRGRSRANDADSWSEPRVTTILQRLRDDPALRLSDTGRSILRHLHHSTYNAIGFKQYIDKIPDHRTGTIAELARINAGLWIHLARQLEWRSEPRRQLWYCGSPSAVLRSAGH
jgi:ParB-like chromosome segregation protein Spo0J